MEDISTEQSNNSKRTLLIKQHALDLGKYFDSVLVIATKHVQKIETTTKFYYSHGNFYANKAAAEEFLTDLEYRE